MATNDDSLIPYTSHAKPVKAPLPSTQDKIPEEDTIRFLLRTIFRMRRWDWALIAILIASLFAHYIFDIFACAPLTIDIVRLIAALSSAFFIGFKIKDAYKSKDLITTFFKNHPIQLFVSIIACGATLSFFLPLTLNLFKFIGDTDKLTTSLLASTGGVIAVFTLIKTHQKNLHDELSLKLDRAKYENQIMSTKLQAYQMEEQKRQFYKNLEQESNKNKQERIRQIHAERRSRYARAIDQLAGEKATVRLGGVYALVSLVDEWLNDTSIKKNKRKKEGQTIINNLCSYIRSPFEIAEPYYIFDKENLTEYDLEKYDRDKIFKDKSEFHGEKHVRQAILHEIKSRLSSGNAQDKEGAWSNFTYDFSNSRVFYTFDLSNGFLSADSNFSNINFLCDAKFNSTTFKNTADFSNAVFHGSAEFSHTTFEDIAYFWKAEFKESATFEGAQFKSLQGILTSSMQSSDSQYLQFKSSADFRQAIFGKIAKFGRAKFYGSADFRETWFQTRSPFFHTLGTLKIYAEFSQNSDPHNYIFDKLHDKSCLIDTKTKTYEIKLKWGEGKYLPIKKRFNIPTGCHLFKP